MKKIVYILTLWLCSMGIQAQTNLIPQIYTPLSFRSQALGGVVFDNLDLIYDPIELRFVNGIRLYTNLSNLTSSDEEIFNDISDNEYLFGISGKNALVDRMWHSFLIRYEDSNTPSSYSFDSNLDGLADFFPEGFFHNLYTEFTDTDGDGLYDLRREIDQEKDGFNRRKLQNVLFNNSYVTANWTLGLRLGYQKTTNERNTSSGFYGTHFGPLIGIASGDPMTTLNFDLFSVQENFRSFNQHETGDFLYRSSGDQLLIHLAAMGLYNVATLTKVELRTDFAYIKDKQKTRVDDQYTGRVENFSQDIAVFSDFYEENDGRVSNQSTKGDGFLLAFSAKRIFQKGLERKDDGFWKFQAGILRRNFDTNRQQSMDFASNQNFFDGTDTLNTDFTTSVNRQIKFEDVGNGHSTSYFGSGLVNFPLGERVHVGLGAFFSYQTSSTTTDFVTSTFAETDVQILDSDLSNDSVKTIVASLTSDRKEENSLYQVVLPVGIEYKFTKNLKWSLRFGSIFTYSRMITNFSEDITDSQPTRTTTVYGDGTSYLRLSDNVYESTSLQRKSGESFTNFVYGLGFTPTEHLQIDLLGFLGTASGLQLWDVEFIRSFRISFSLKL